MMRPSASGILSRACAALMTARLPRMSSGKGATLHDAILDVQREVFATCRHPALRSVAGLLVKVQPLLVIIDELNRDPDGLAGRQFALVEGMGLGGEERGLALLPVTRPEPDDFERLVHGPVEQDM